MEMRTKYVKLCLIWGRQWLDVDWGYRPPEMEYCARVEHARGRNLAYCGRICGSPVNQLNEYEKVFQMKEWVKTFHKPESKMFYVPQCAKLVE